MYLFYPLPVFGAESGTTGDALGVADALGDADARGVGEGLCALTVPTIPTNKAVMVINAAILFISFTSNQLNKLSITDCNSLQ